MPTSSFASASSSFILPLKISRKQSSNTLNGSPRSDTVRPLNHRPSRSFAPTPPPEPNTPIKFQWVKGELIGQGSYGRVYLALNTTGELMAVKQVELPQTASDRSNVRQREVVEALKFESKTLQFLGEHENIVQYLGFEETQATLNIFLQYVPGGTISSILKKHGPFSESVTKYFARQITTGLEFLHSKKVLHRDLKGENILVQQDGVCKISDFGISKHEDTAGQAFTGMKGTVYWMAPEVVDSKQKGYDAKVDIWSLGCVLLEMWTAARPWVGDEVISVMLKLYKDKQPPPIAADVKAGLSDSALDFYRECCAASVCFASRDRSILTFIRDPRQRPSALLLLQHPYLNTLPPDWVFSLSDLERTLRKHDHRRKSKSSKHRNSSAPASRHRRVATAESAPPIPAPSERTLRPTDHLRPPSITTAVAQIPSKPRSSGPPAIVYITPPNSPKISSRSSSFSATSGSTRSSNSAQPQKKKKFLVANPDPTPEDRRAGRFRTPFVYTPPPLPAAAHPSALPSRLSSVASERRLTPAASMQNLAAHAHVSHPTASSSSSSMTTRSDAYSVSDSDSDGYSYGMWKKPPEAQGGRSPSPSPSKARKKAHRKSIIETKRDTTWAPRPGVGDVYSHLDEFFPRVDLDKPLDTTPTTPGLSDRQRRTKSIRMQAEEINRLNRMQDPSLQRRATRLWGHRIEEVRTGTASSRS
ncbi:Protein kinase domain-containing protein [Mycena kentingensis (nom. inval.)]|nr:Protein kinase domain-containing protein [Mycena kentingensis (nom. inval.)]